MKLGVFGIEKIESKIISTFKRYSSANLILNNDKKEHHTETTKISLLLNTLNLDFDYSLLSSVDKLYIPLKYFEDKKYFNLIQYLSTHFNLYIYMPTIIRKNHTFDFDAFNIKGLVISHLSQIKMFEDFNDKFDMVANYTFNVFNSYSSNFITGLNINYITISPELDEPGIISFCKKSSCNKELIVYGYVPVMTMNYCLLGKSNHCYKDCSHLCTKSFKYYLKDRLNMCFRVIPDNTRNYKYYL